MSDKNNGEKADQFCLIGKFGNNPPYSPFKKGGTSGFLMKYTLRRYYEV